MYIEAPTVGSVSDVSNSEQVTICGLTIWVLIDQPMYRRQTRCGGILLSSGGRSMKLGRGDKSHG